MDLSSLIPLFEDCLTIYEIKSLANDLWKKRCISKGFSKRVKKGGSAGFTLVNALHVDKVSEWSHILQHSLCEMGRAELAEIVVVFVSEQASSNFKWFISHWNEVINTQNIFVGLEDQGWELTSDKTVSMLHIAFSLTKMESDSKVAQTLIDDLAKKLSANQDCETAVDVGKLMDLIPMLATYLNPHFCVKLSTDLCLYDRITEESHQNMRREAHANPQDAVRNLCKAIADNARPGWAKDMVNCISIHSEILGQVVDLCLHHKTFLWITSKWTQLEEKRNRVQSLLEAFEIRIHEDEMWLLNSMIALSTLDEENLEPVVQSLKRILHRSANIDDKRKHSASPHFQGNQTFNKLVNVPPRNATSMSTPQFGVLPTYTSQPAWCDKPMPNVTVATQGARSNNKEDFHNPFSVETSLPASSSDIDHPKEPLHSMVGIHQLSSYSNSRCASNEQTKAELPKQSNFNNGQNQLGKTYVAGQKANLSAAQSSSTSNESRTSYKQKTGEQSNKTQEHQYDLRSQKSSDVEIKCEQTCSEPYRCNVKKFQTPSGERKVELRVVLDHNIPEHFALFVYVDHVKAQYPMHEDGLRSGIYHTFLFVPESKDSIVYKYLLRQNDGSCEKWEVLPSSCWASGHQNRKANINQCVTILFDVASTEKKIKMQYDFASMYARHMQKHLPPILFLNPVDDTSDKQSFSVFLEYLSNWREGSEHGVRLTQCSGIKIAPTCKSLLRGYVEKLCSNDIVYQRILGCVAISLTLHKYGDVFYAEDKNSWEKFCIAISVHEVDENTVEKIAEILLQFVCTSDILSALDVVIEWTRYKPHCLLVIPLYYVVMNEGNFQFKEEIWKETCRKLKINQLMRNVRGSDMQKNVVDVKKQMLASVVKLPHLSHVLQQTLKFETVVLLLNEEPSFYEYFDAEKLLQLINLQFQTATPQLPLLLRNQTLLDWMYAEIEKKHLTLTGTVNTAQHESNLHKALKSFIWNLCNTVQMNFEKLVLWSVHMLLLTTQEEAVLFNITDKIMKWLSKFDKGVICKREVEFWNKMFAMDVKNAEVSALWKHVLHCTVSKLMLKKLQTEMDRNLVIFKSFEKLNPVKEVEACFATALCDFTLKLSKEKTGRFTSWLLGSDFRKVLPILEKVLVDQWTKQARSINQKIINFLKWSFSVVFFKLFEDAKVKQTLKNSTKKIMTEIEESLLHVLESLMSGDVTVQEMEDLFEDVDSFTRGLALVSIDSESSVDDSTATNNPNAIVSRKKKEWETFQQFRNDVAYFCHTCKTTIDNVPDVFDRLQADVSETCWRDVIECSDKDCYLKMREPDVILFNLTDEQKKALKEINECKVDGHSFIKNLWTSYACDVIVHPQSSDGNDARISLDDVIQLIWNKLKYNISSLKMKLDDGTILLEEVEKHFKSEAGDFDSKDVEKMVAAIFLFPDFDSSVATTENVKPLKLMPEMPAQNKQQLKKENALRDSDDDDDSSDDELDTDFQIASCNPSTPKSEPLDVDSASDDGSFRSVSPAQVVAASADAPADPDARKQFRIEQISSYFVLKSQQENVDALYELQDCLQLGGDFGFLDILKDKNRISADKGLNAITKNVMEMGRSYIKNPVSDEQIEFLSEFLRHEDLILWLKDNMKDRGEVKVMSDLAMISVGDTPIEVDRVASFNSSVMGFAPLIFDLSPNSGLNDVMDALSRAWENKERDGKLLQNWEMTSQYLEWLKGIKDFHGSVEKSSLLRAQQINSHGMYVIGGRSEIPTVENSMVVIVEGESEFPERKKLTFSELHDLQSRLMLIADKGLDDVKHFITNLSHVENLAKAFVNLKVAGCLLFNNWTARLRCTISDTENRQTDGTSLEITFDDQSPHIICHENAIMEMRNVTHVMEQVLERWKVSLSEKRSAFYHLNHFNIQQIMYLCRHLSSVTPDHSLPDQVYTLLSLIKLDITHAEIVRCLGEATEGETCEEEEPEESVNAPKEISLTEKKRELVKKLVEEHISENVAKASVQAAEEDDLNYDDLFIWCLENEYDEENIESLNRAYNQDAGFDSGTVEIVAIESVVKDRSNLSLQGVVEKLMTECGGATSIASVAVKTVCDRYLEENAVTSLSDCISLLHLGQFVENVGSRVDERRVPNRELPTSLQPGSPHLVICPAQDTVLYLLSLYMNSPEQVLPGSSEVLMCHEETSESDVELLLRRAITQGDRTGRRLCCIAGTENLNFEVANSLETTWQHLKKSHNSRDDYQLVIICSDQQHYVASLFHEFKADYTLKYSVEEFQNYLEEKLCVKKEDHPASVVGGRSVVVVSSKRAGLGKSLYISRLRSKLREALPACHVTTIRFLEKQCSHDDVISSLLRTDDVKNNDRHFVHIDVTPSVEHGVDRFLFNLLIPGSFENTTGKLWKKQPQHMYCIEYTFRKEDTKKCPAVETLLSILPSVKCISPREVLELANDPRGEAVMMDEQELTSSTYQRPYQYLRQYATNRNLDIFSYTRPDGHQAECIETLLKYCSLSDPTWSELRHFASFLNCQLEDCEESVFCNAALVGADSGLAGFKKFVVKFMIRMSQDFATPSLKVDDSDTSTSAGDNDVFELHQLRRRWEEGSHPYLFFNEDRVSMSFVNFRINSSGDLLCAKTNQCLERSLMAKSLVEGLKRQGVDLHQNFDGLSREQKLKTVRQVFGVPDAPDPDLTYELTTDNVLKMLAIHMRFRCNIPVVVMGETGCGKTRMVEFMSKLKAGWMRTKQKKDGTDEAAAENQVQNMVIVKVHGGITVSHIHEHIKKAVNLAVKNRQENRIDTILFFDEANTTEAIYAIKEFLCDRSIHGEVVDECGLRIVAACNPYRKHDEDAIKNMEAAGLGFRIKTEDTVDKLGDIPMRCLVYRVIALPPSMQPLVWDFGQLQNESEKVYIEQMVQRLAREKIGVTQRDTALIVEVLANSQSYMRQKRNECHFVSLRDVERCLVSFRWFCNNKWWLFPHVDSEKETSNKLQKLHPVNRCLILAVGMCYHVTLASRDEYRQVVSNCFGMYGLNVSDDQILEEIVACQSVFLNNIDLDDDVARNEALRENVFMIVMCTEMRIPLFLVGKPGSSKSLAKTIVTDAMQGMSSNNEVFRRLKQIQVLSFQCSPVTDAVGIESVFRQCMTLQEKQDPSKFVAVAVLDEIGLAEDSPKMPLKILHPLLESGNTDGSTDSATDLIMKETDTHRRVGFVGISNWALDPAKMNRGVFVHRGAPTENDLKLTAKGIFTSKEEESFREISKIVDAVTESYWHVCRDQENSRSDEYHQVQEFFGLRDYYGLLKMIFSVVSEKDRTLSSFDVAYAVLRNFSGGRKDCLGVFSERLKLVDPDFVMHSVTLKTMLRDNLRMDGLSESRYLLLMSNHFTAIDLLAQVVDSSNFQVIFGSSFPQDNNYTEVCRNINRIKMCMESGRTVVLLNLRDLYESLYDALNQHYVTFAGQRYVDLGLGGHRVKCRVAEDFRLIVIEDMNVVYNEFPIPLINRLEKHIFTTTSILDTDQQATAQRLREWSSMFCKIQIPFHLRMKIKQFTEREAFVGYTKDTAASAVLSASGEGDVFEGAKALLLNTASMDSVFRLKSSDVRRESEKHQELYLYQQSHDNLIAFFEKFISDSTDFSAPYMMDIVSFSQILSDNDRQKLEGQLRLEKNSIMLLTLQQFQTADEFTKKVDTFLSRATEESSTSEDHPPLFILLIQCPHAHSTANLVACAKYTVKNLIRCTDSKEERHDSRIVIAFLHTVERVSGTGGQLKSFLGSDSLCVYVDELRVSFDYIGFPSKLWKMSLHEIFQAGFVPPGNGTAGTDNASNWANPDFCLDFPRLMKSCVSTALVKLRSEVENPEPGRIKKLVALLSERELVSMPFLHSTAKHIVDIMGQREQQVVSPNSWMTDEARSHDSLNEGGSFSKTLWLYLKQLTSSALAYVISKVDEDRNLDILCSDDQSRLSMCLKELWINLFQVSELFQFKWRDILANRKEFLVKGKTEFTCAFPFGRRIIDFFRKHWKLLQHADKERQEAAFHSKVGSTQMSQVLQNAEGSSEVLKCFVQDLVSLLYKSGTGQKLEMRLAENVIMEMFTAKQQDLHYSTGNISCLVACVFVLFKNVSSQLQQIGTMLSSLPEIVTNENVDLWKTQQKGHPEIVTQLSIFETVQEHLKQQSDNITNANDYRKWSDLIGQLRSTAQEIIKQPRAEELEKVWKALEFADLFLDQLIPQGLPADVYDRYLALLVPLSKRLWKGAVKAGLRNEKFLKIVVKILAGCCKDVSLKLLLNWKDLSCTVCKKAKVVEPVLLPCQHYMCLMCLKLSVTHDVRQCPKCRIELPAGFDISPSRLSAVQAGNVEAFTANCTSFFLEYLSTLCFPAPGADVTNLTVAENVTDVLHELVIVKKSTRDMSPLETAAFDEAPTVRSFILQLLLRYNQEAIESHLEKHFNRVGAILEDKRELMMIYIQCVEDSQRNRAASLDRLLALLEEQATCIENADDLNQVQHLSVVAKLRFAVEVLAQSVYAAMTEGVKHEDFVADAINVVQDIPMVKDYFVKVFCRRYGINYFSKLLDDSNTKCLVPLYLYSDDSTLAEMPDKLVASGNVYVESKKILLRADTDENRRDAVDRVIQMTQESPDAAVQVLLATIAAARGSTAADIFKDMFVKHLSTSSHVGNDDGLMFDILVEQDLIDDEDPYVKKVVNDLLADVFLTVRVQQQALMKDLYDLMTNPNLITNRFLPTMPESSYFDYDVRAEIARWIGNYQLPPKEYLCPNNHLYYIGDCTNPVKIDAVCPECKAPIGGVSERVLKPGNKAGTLTEESQMGYLLPQSESISVKPAPERSCSRASVCVMRFLLHGVMLISLENGFQVVRSALHFTTENEASMFLTRQLKSNLQQFSQCLGKSFDDAALLIHQVLRNIRIGEEQPTDHQTNLRTMIGRKLWEAKFQQRYLTPIFSQADERVNDARKALLESKQKTDLDRLVFEITSESSEEIVDAEDQPNVVYWDDPTLWKYRVNVSVDHVRQKLEGIDTTKEAGGVIIKLLLDKGSLSLVSHLKEILNTQFLLQRRYQRKVDTFDVENIKLSEYLQEPDCMVTPESIQLYIDLWNENKGDIAATYRLPSEYCGHTMSLESPISMCLPSKVGRGLCALSLAEYVIDQQNALLQECRELINPTPRFESVSIDQLTSNDLVCIENDRVLLPYVLANSQYEATTTASGSKHKIVYRIPALEKQITQRFILHKKLINKESVPCIEYLQDVGIEKQCTKLKENVEQKPLPVKLVQKLEDKMRGARLADICEAVRTLTLVIEYLSTIGSNGNQLLRHYVTHDLILPAEEAAMIPDTSQLWHTLALFEWFSCQRSVKYITSGQDPFKNIVKEENRAPLEDLASVREWFSNIQLDQLQLELNSLLVVKSELHSDTSLKEYLEPLSEEKEADTKWVEKMPAEILVKHAVSLFNLSVRNPL